MQLLQTESIILELNINNKKVQLLPSKFVKLQNPECKHWIYHLLMIRQDLKFVQHNK